VSSHGHAAFDKGGTEGWGNDSDSSDREAWEAYVPEILDAIKTGYLDSSLKDLVKTGWERAQKIGVASAAKKTTTSDLLELQTDVPVVGETASVFPVTMNLVGTFAYGGARYYRTQMVGTVVRLRNVGASSWYMEGALIKIVSIGNKRVKGRFLVDPRPLHPNSYQLEKLWTSQQANADFNMFIEPSWFAHAFQA
jgi:hypothetical protein